jgi:hypothetical protein
MNEIRNIKITNDSKFPLEIGVIVNPEGKVEISIGMDESVSVEPVSNGKLTGIQMRTIAAKDQLETLLQDRLFDAIKCLAEARPDELARHLSIASDPHCFEFTAEPHPEAGEIPGMDILKAITAMALFCYTEIVERGLKQPGKQE